MRRFLLAIRVILLLAVCMILNPGDHPQVPTPAARSEPAPALALGKLPLVFEPNRGQADPKARFLTHTPGGTIFFASAEIVLAWDTAAGVAGRLPGLSSPPAPGVRPAASTVRLHFVGANPAPDITAGDLLPGKINYLLGNNPAQWQANVPTYNSITYHNLYPGIDLTYTGSGGQLKGTYTVAPGADAGQIRWQYEGTNRATLDAAGNLQIPIAAAACDSVLTEEAPVAWQEVGGQHTPVVARYAVQSDGSIHFILGPHDPMLPLTLDPALIYSTYLGGSGDEQGLGSTLDGAGNIYVTGWTSSPNFPLASPYQPVFAGVKDAFVTKLNPAGSALIYSTYLGGNDDDEGFYVVVDGSGAAYVTGKTLSLNFPLHNPIQATQGGLYDAFITKLSPNGSALVYSTYLGGTSNDQGINMVVDATGALYVVGDTGSPNFPTANAYQGTLHGNSDAYALKVNPAGTALIYSTFLGGSGQEGGYGLAVNAAGNAFLTGITRSFDFPVLNALQPVSGGGSGDVYVTELNTTGSGLVYSTYLGGGGEDYAFGLALDAAGNVYIAGPTNSTNFPLLNPIQPTLHGDYDVFVSKINAGGGSLGYSTYLGGGGGDYAADVAVDSIGSAYVTGWTSSPDFPLFDPIQQVFGAPQDAFLTRLDPAGSAWIYSTFLGGSGSDYGEVVTLDSQANVYLIGFTDASNFPVVNPYQATNGGGSDAFIAKIAKGNPPPTPSPSPTPTGTPPSATPTSTNPPSSTSTNTPTTVPSNTPTTTATVCPVQFNDVNITHPFYVYVHCLACRGIVSGYQCGAPGEPCPGAYFRPYSNITRGQVAKIVANSAGYSEAIPSTQQTFTDVPSGQPFWLWIERAALHGVLNGYQCGGVGEPCDPQHRPYFRPANDVTRGQLAKIDANAAGYVDPIPSTQQSFSDVPYSDVFWVYIERVNGRGIISGYTCGQPPAGPCDPQQRPYFLTYNNVTRGQAAKIVANTFFPNCQTPIR